MGPRSVSSLSPGTGEMAEDPKSRTAEGLIRVLPQSVTGPEPQNPAPFAQVGQVDESRVRAVADQILRVFLNSLPSNYVSQVTGPQYAQNFAAVAEELARIQVSAEDAYEDTDYDFTRSEVLFQFLGDIVFPTSAKTGLPDLDGDLTFREFLQKMVSLLLQGSKTVTLQQGIEALTDAEIEILEKYAFIGKPGVAWGPADRFTFEVNVSKHRRTTPTPGQNENHYHTVSINAAGDGVTLETIGVPDTEAHTHTIEGFVVGSASSFSIIDHTHDLLSDFADLPLILESNIRIVLRALRPAHTLYEHRNLFRESFRDVFEDDYNHLQLSSYYYEDFRKLCRGIKEISGTTAAVLSDRYTLNDVVSFRAVQPGSLLVIETGSNAGRYEVREAVSFPFGDDPVARPYTTSPTGLTGSATVSDGAIVDAAQNWALAVPGEILTFSTGANAGRYILETLLGANGGALGVAAGPATSVRPAVGFLRIRGPRFPAVATGISFTVGADRLGVRTPIEVTNEDVSEQFWSPPAASITSILVAHGPLVRDYGDATPATRRDVTVLYDGAPVTVADVNPYLGEITLAAPIAAFTPGDHTLTVSYRWFPSPLVGMAGLNTKGLTLNRWDSKRGRNTTSPGTGTPGGGGLRTSRFPMNVALGRFPTRRAPVRVAHRYIAFERTYTAALNSPTTLLLNQAPGRVSVPYARTEIEPTTVQYEGATTPPSPWVATGTVTGTSTGDLYELNDASTTSVGYWSRDFELPVSSAIGSAARFQVNSYTLDGVFTGIGFGFHNDRRLYLAGALVVNGLKHVGLLARPGDVSELSSWIVGPKTDGVVQSATIVTCAMSEAPKLIGAGGRFQILTGAQAGVYEIAEVFFERDRDLVTIEVVGGFPADPDLFGNRDVSLVFETEWDAGMCTWRLYANTRSNAAQLMFGGATGGTLSVEGSPILASPAYLGPDVLPEGSGRFLWGSFDRAATSQSTWDFVRYLSTPDGSAKFSRGTVVDTTMTEDPEDGDWFLMSPFGDSAVSAGSLRLTATSGDSQYGYGLIDPFLNGRRITALDATLTVSRDTSAAGGAALLMKDTHREARLGTITYQDNGSAGKEIIPQASISLIGATAYTAQGWEAVEDTAFEPPTVFANGPDMVLTGAGGELSWTMRQELTPSLSGTGRDLEFRLAMSEYTLSSSNATGLTFMATVANRLITLTFDGPDVVNLVPTGPAIPTAVDWSDGVARTYRVEVVPTSNAVRLYVDDTLVATTTYLGFPAVTATPDAVTFGYIAEADASFEASLRSLCFMERLDGVADVHRTFGIWKGGDPTDIDNWAVPRTDGGPWENSDVLSTIVEMDWRSECWVRLFVDPTFGAGFLRPDLAPPASYTGNFATQSMDPTAAWALVEYAKLPRAESATRFGSVFFGALNPDASSVQTWNEVRYRVFTHTSIDYRAPQRMTLNQWNVITSGDYLKDISPESVVIASLTRTRISLRSAHLVASRIFHVAIEGVPLSTDAWTFNSDSQQITLSTPLPSVGYPVTVVFAPGKPITTTYLQSQPLNESQTILNEGTPPVPMSQVGQATVTTVSGDGGPTPAFPPAGPGDASYFLRDPYLVRKFEEDPDLLYEQMEFFQIDDGGSTGEITTFCDESVAGNGLREVSVSGATYSEDFGPLTTIHASTPFGRGSGSSATILYASGVASGASLGLIGPASYATPFTGPNPAPTGVRPAMTYPNSRSGGVVGGTAGGALNRETLWVLRTGAAPGVVTVFTPGMAVSSGGSPVIPSNVLTTEGGEILTTEGGDMLTTEG